MSGKADGRMKKIRFLIGRAGCLLVFCMIFWLSGCRDGSVWSLQRQMDVDAWKEAAVSAVGGLCEDIEELGLEPPVSGSLAASDSMTEESGASGDVYQILLIGSDRRAADHYGNSDVMLLCSVNRAKQTISLVSFMRDLGVTIPGYGYGKLNSAYARGGGALLKQTIEHNFQIEIDHYAAADFDGVARVIDLLGGVTIDVTAEELPVMNGCISEACNLQGIDPAPYHLTSAGVWHLNGIQAVAYCRNRSVGRWDFDRTARQRRVLEQALVNAKQLQPAQMLSVAGQVFSLITHDIPAEQMAQLVAMAASAKDYALVTDRVPYDGLYRSNNGNLDPVWTETITRLHESLY